MRKHKAGHRTRRRRRILMVEDDALILGAVADMLTAKDYHVTKARDGLEALERFRDSPCDLVILDVVLPKIDGHDLCRLMRQEEGGRLLPIIVFTALGPQDIAKLPGLSADAYVAKGPLAVVIPNILTAIKAVLTRRRGRPGQRIFGYEGFRPRRIVSDLFALKQYYKRLVHAGAEVVIVLDVEAKILSANLVALQLLRRSETEARGLPFADLLTSRGRTVLRSFLARPAQGPLGVAGSDLTLAGTRRRLRFRPVLHNEVIAGFLVTGGS